MADEECLRDGLGCKRPHRGVDEESQARPSIHILLFDELVVRRPATEPARQHLLEHPDHVGVEEGHPARGELLDATDVAEVERPAEPLQRTSAPPPVELATSPIETLRRTTPWRSGAAR